jgi:regulatory protein
MRESDPKPGAPAVRLAAMNLLARREHSLHELLDKLASRFPELDPATGLLPVLQQLQAEGLQSDQRCAEAFARYRSSRGIGPLRIRAELQQRRIASDLIEAALQQESLDWEALCRAVFRRKFRRNEAGAGGRVDARERARWQRFLLQRGFSQGQIRVALQAGNDDPDDDFLLGPDLAED